MGPDSRGQSSIHWHWHWHCLACEGHWHQPPPTLPTRQASMTVATGRADHRAACPVCCVRCLRVAVARHALLWSPVCGPLIPGASPRSLVGRRGGCQGKNRACGQPPPFPAPAFAPCRSSHFVYYRLGVRACVEGWRSALARACVLGRAGRGVGLLPVRNRRVCGRTGLALSQLSPGRVRGRPLPPTPSFTPDLVSTSHL